MENIAQSAFAKNRCNLAQSAFCKMIDVNRTGGSEVKAE